MKSRLIFGAALCSTVVLSALAVQAQQADQPASPDVAASDALSTSGADWAGYAHVGYRLDPHWRMDLQGGYHAGAPGPASASGDSASFCAAATAGAACASRDRALGSYAMVANLIFDVSPDSHWVDPYVGVGFGVSRPDPNVAAANPVMQILQMNARDTAFAYQALVGLAFRPHDRLRLDLTYRWLNSAALASQPAALGGRYQDETLAVSVRYAFSMPRAAVAPTPTFGFAARPVTMTSPPSRTVVVETPSNPAALAAEAEAAVRQAAVSATQGQSSQVVVDGHADTNAAADYNQRLAERRSKAMGDAMVALGVPIEAVQVQWGGEAAAPAPEPAAAPVSQTLAAKN